MANISRSNSVTVENQDVALIKSVAVGRGPISDIAVDAHSVVVTNFGDDSVAVLDSETLTVRADAVAGQPTAVALAGDRAFVAVSSASYDAIVVIDTTTGGVLKEYPLSFTVTAIVASQDGKRVYAGRAGENGIDVSVIDVTAERIGTIYIAKGADATIDAMRLDASGRRLYVAASDARSSRLITVDVETSRVRRTLEIGAAIRGLELGLGDTAYVLTSDIADGGVLYFVDLVANRVTDTVRVAEAPTQLVLSADGTRAYVVDYGQVVVASTDTRTVVATVTVGARPSAIAVSDDRLFIADFSGGIAAYAVASPMPMLYPQFVTPALAPKLRQLQPAV
jgi:YVTN family beta-propeller protein